MKSQKRSFRSTLALALIASLVFNPLYSSRALASQKSEFHTVCDPINQGGTNADGSSNGGDQAKGECAKAEMGMNASQAEKTKTIIFGTATAIVTAQIALEMVPYTSGMAKAICQYLSTAASASGMFLNKSTTSSNSEVVGKFASTASQVMSTAGMAMGASSLLGKNLMASAGNLITGGSVGGTKTMGAISDIGKATGDTTKATETAKQNKASCVTSAVMLGLQAGIAGLSWGGASKTFNTALFNAKSISASAKSSTTQLALNGGANVNNSGVAQNPKPTGSTSVISETCDDKAGNEYIRCMGQTSPELAAISNNPDFLDTMEKALGGKSLGDFAKGFKGDTQQDAANYIGSALGMSGGTVAKLMDSQQKLAQDTGAMDKYEPMAYARVAGSSSHISDKAPDFNKMMADMLKQLNPDADPKKDDPAELVFRQMDLLPPEKIEQNKDISLFARVGYRYRKNLSNVEQLNWSRTENQQNAQK